MAQSPLVIAATLSVGALLTGCGSSDNLDVAEPGECGSAFNPAANVRLALNSFVLDQPADLQQTRFRDLLDGVQPSDSDGQTIADDVARLTKPFIGAEFPESGGDNEAQGNYVSVRNPSDLLNIVIGSDTVNNFNRGRQYISSCIDAGNAGQYSTGANQVTIQFEETDGTEVTDRYRYPVLRWVYVPDTGEVIRTSRYSGAEDAFIGFAFSEVRFKGLDFSISGFNRPTSARTIIAAREIAEDEDEGQSLSLNQQFVGSKTDSWQRSGEKSFQFDGANVDCARVVVDYPMARVDVYTSNEIAPEAEGYCGTKESADQSYSAEAVGRRQ